MHDTERTIPIGNGDSSPRRPAVRPRGLRWVCLALVAMGVIHAGVMLRALFYGAAYQEQGVSVPPLLPVFTGGGWALVLLYSGWRLWAGRNGSPRWVFLVVGAYGLYRVIWWVAFARADYARGQWPFVTLGTGVLVAFVLWVIGRLRWQT